MLGYDFIPFVSGLLYWRLEINSPYCCMQFKVKRVFVGEMMEIKKSELNIMCEYGRRESV